ncbi:MAG: hypothetical protein U0840_09350 [Gemmataceae bacterium]
MTTTTHPPMPSPLRDLHLMANPALWSTWPFLPLVRRSHGQEELGLLFDMRAIAGQTGYRCTVWRANLFLLPRSLDAFLALPKEVFDTFEEVVAAGWRVD